MSRPLTGRLSGDPVWQGQVRVAGDLILPPGSTLTLRPGTEVLFLPPLPGKDTYQDHPNFPGAELIIQGRLVAEGNATAPILFRHADSKAPAGSWGGINLSEGSSASFSYCYFTQADSAVHSQSSSVAVRDSIFTHNLVGIRFNSTEMLIEHNLLLENGTAVRFHFGAPLIRANRFTENDKTFFITSYPDDYLIAGNRIDSSSDYHVVLGEEVPEDVDFGGNYWGTADEAAILRKVLDGRRIDYLGKVRLEPLLLTVPQAGPTWSR